MDFLSEVFGRIKVLYKSIGVVDGQEAHAPAVYVVNGGTGGGGDATAANQALQIAEAQETNDLLPAAAGTRLHNADAITRQAVGAASARVPLPTLAASREVYVMATGRCFFRTGDNAVVAASGTSHPLAGDERFYFRVPAGHTHIAYIRDSADGFITICPVA